MSTQTSVTSAPLSVATAPQETLSDPDVRYEMLRSDFLSPSRPSARKPKPPRLEEADLALLEEYQQRQWLHPFKYSLPYLLGLFYFTQKFNVTLLRNPLRKTDVQVNVGSRIRWIYFASVAMFTVPLIHMKYVFKYASAEMYVYEKYKHLVEDYVIARDEAILRAALAEGDGLLALRK